MNDGAGTLTIHGDVQYGRIPLWIFEAVRDSQIGPLAVVLYGWLMLRYSHMHRGIFPSHKTLAGELGISDRHVKTVLGQLRSIGAIDWREQRLSSGGKTVNTYVVAWLAPREFGPWEAHPTMGDRNHSSHPLGTTVPTPPGTTVPTKKTEEEEDRSKKTPRPPATSVSTSTPPARSAHSTEIENDFDDWYSGYPRKEDRGDALKAYRAARTKGATKEQLLTGARAYAAQRKGEDRKFTKLPATWLRAEAWLNEPTAPTVTAAERRLWGSHADRHAATATHPRQGSHTTPTPDTSHTTPTAAPRGPWDDLLAEVAR